MTNKEEKELEALIIALFLLMSKHSKKISPLLIDFKKHRDLLKDKVNAIYAKYSKNGILKLSPSELNKEMKSLNPILKQIGNDLYKKEHELFIPLLFPMYKQAYTGTYEIINKFMDVEMIKLNESLINESILHKIDGKTLNDRNMDNKEKLINKVKIDIKSNLWKGAFIEVINKNIDKQFNQGANRSVALLDNEIATNFNNAQMIVYKYIGIDRVVYNSVLESNTCGVCESLHDTVFDIDTAPDLPLHNRCQCFYTPTIE